MITGVAAFHGDTPVVVALKQIREYPKRPREIVPELSGAVESVIMKCLQKDPARRFRSTDDLEIALVKAGKARPLSPWEAAINRRLAHAEHEIRNRLRQGAESTKAFLKRQDWQRLLRSQEEHKVILGAAGLVGVLAVSLLLFGDGRPARATRIPSKSRARILLRPPLRGMAPIPNSHRYRRRILCSRSHRMMLTCMRTPSWTLGRLHRSIPVCRISILQLILPIRETFLRSRLTS